MFTYRHLSSSFNFNLKVIKPDSSLSKLNKSVNCTKAELTVKSLKDEGPSSILVTSGTSKPATKSRIAAVLVKLNQRDKKKGFLMSAIEEYTS